MIDRVQPSRLSFKEEGRVDAYYRAGEQAALAHAVLEASGMAATQPMGTAPVITFTVLPGHRAESFLDALAMQGAARDATLPLMQAAVAGVNARLAAPALTTIATAPTVEAPQYTAALAQLQRPKNGIQI